MTKSNINCCLELPDFVRVKTYVYYLYVKNNYGLQINLHRYSDLDHFMHKKTDYV